MKLQRPSSDRLSWLLLKDDIAPRDGELGLLEELRKNCEPIRAGSELARSFAEVARTRDAGALATWTEQALQAASAKEMTGLARGLIRDWPEVRAAVECRGTTAGRKAMFNE